MKRALLGLLLLAGCATPRSEAPKVDSAAPPEAPREAPPVVEGDVTEAHLGGMTVLVKRVKNAELVAAQLYVRGGALNWSKANAGIEQLALHVASTGGTTTLDKAAFARKLAGLGAELKANTTRDWSVLQAKGPLQARPALLELLAEVLLRPAMPANEVEIAKEQQLVAIQRREEDPDERLQVFADEVRFKGHPYSARPEGTAESVKALTQAQLSAYLEGLRATSRLVLVVVGDVEAGPVLAQAAALFGALPKGVAPAQAPAAAPFAANALSTQTRKLATNYVMGMFLGPTPGSADYAPGLAATRVLRERLFFEVRTKRNLSYAPAAPWDRSGAGTYGGIYVTAVDPNTTLRVMIEQLQRMKTEPVSAAELAGAKAQARTGMYLPQESTDGQASTLGSDLLLTGDWRFQPKLNVQLQAVTAEQVQAYAKKYIAKMQVVLLGDPDKLDPSIATSL